MRITRRELLITSAAALLAITACEQNRTPAKLETKAKAPEVTAQKYNPRDFIYPSIREFMQDKNKDPLFRAASVTIYNSLGGYGHGSLVENNGELLIYTVSHVPKNLGFDDISKKPLPMFAHVPGIDFYNLDQALFHFNNRAGDLDPPAWYQFPLVPRAELRSAVNRGAIKPLTLTTGYPRAFEQVAIARADTGKYTIYESETYYTNSYDLKLKFKNQGIICSGISGGPVLKRNPQGVIAPETYGVISQGLGERYADPEKQVNGPCFLEVSMKVN